MNIDKEIILNLFAQGLYDYNQMIYDFNSLDFETKKEYLKDFVTIIIQSKPVSTDVEIAIFNSKLKSTYTPCVILKKGIEKNSLLKITELPLNELEKAFILLIHLFRIAYLRRYKIEKNDPTKWWYWDFSDEINFKKLDLVRNKTIT
jgi:thiamine pyrophosphokinase